MLVPLVLVFLKKIPQNHLIDDPRNRLVERVADFVEEFLPDFLIMENVKELLRGKHIHHFHGLCERLKQLNYSLYADVHQLSEYGLPQRRERALVIARRNRGFIGHPLIKKVEKRSVWETISHLPKLDAGEIDPCDPMHVSPGMTSKVKLRIQAIPKDGGSWGDIMYNPNISDEEKHKLLIPSMFRARPGSFPDVYGRLKWHDVAATITRECGHVGKWKICTSRAR